LVDELFTYRRDQRRAANSINSIINDRGAKKAAGRWQGCFRRPDIEDGS
jgi:hypothetical protein